MDIIKLVLCPELFISKELSLKPIDKSILIYLNNLLFKYKRVIKIRVVTAALFRFKRELNPLSVMLSGSILRSVDR